METICSILVLADLANERERMTKHATADDTCKQFRIFVGTMSGQVSANSSTQTPTQTLTDSDTHSDTQSAAKCCIIFLGPWQSPEMLNTCATIRNDCKKIAP